MKTGVELIAAERERQIKEEGWTPEHDQQHHNEELAFVAALYAAPPHSRILDIRDLPIGWPWGAKWWKPTPNDRIRELTKSGALIAAEIDRLQNQ